MYKKINSYFLIFLIIFFIILLIPVSSANFYNATITGTLPPSSGDWIISNYTSVIDGWVQIEPNQSIIVENGGTLDIFGNVTIELQQITSGINNITILSGGNLSIDSQNGKDNYIKSNNTSLQYDFWIKNGASSSRIKNVTISQAGTNTGSWGIKTEISMVFDNVTIFGGLNGIWTYASSPASTTVNISNSHFYDLGEGVFTSYTRAAVMNIDNSTFNDVNYAIAHPGSNSLIEYNYFENVQVTGLYIERNNTIRHNTFNLTNSKSINLKNYASKCTIWNNTFVGGGGDFILFSVSDLGTEIYGNIFNGTANTNEINIDTSNGILINIHDNKHYTINGIRIKTESNLTAKNIMATQTQYGYQVQAAGKTLTIVNESLAPSGSYAHYIPYDDSYIIKKNYLNLNITDSTGFPVIADIISTDNSSVVQNSTTSSKITIELPYIKFNRSSGTVDSIYKTTSEYNNYSISITNSSYTNSPVMLNLSLSSAQTVTVNLGADMILPPTNIQTTPSQTWINITWDAVPNADKYSVYELEDGFPYVNINPVVDGIKDTIYNYAHEFLIFSPNPITHGDYGTIYPVRTALGAYLLIESIDNDDKSGDDDTIYYFDLNNDGLTINDPAWKITDNVVKKYLWDGDLWAVTGSTNAVGDSTGGGTHYPIHELFIPVAELGSNWTNGSIVKVLVKREDSALNPDVITWYPYGNINNTDTDLWHEMVLNDPDSYNLLSNVTLSNYTAVNLTPFTIYHGAVSSWNGTTESDYTLFNVITEDISFYNVSGYIMDDLGNKLSGAIVYSCNGFVHEITQSDIYGYWIGYNFREGNYTICGNKSGYMDNSTDIYVSSNMTNINITLTAYTITDWEIYQQLLLIQSQNDEILLNMSVNNTIVNDKIDTILIFILLNMAVIVGIIIGKRGKRQ